MNRKQRIILSLIGIFIVSLILIGFTYGFYLARINGNINNTSISVSTAELILEYADGNGELSVADYVTPGNTVKFLTKDKKITEYKTFSVENKGSGSIEYSVILDQLSIKYTVSTTLRDGTVINAGDDTSFLYPEDFKIDITCTSNGDSCYGSNDNTTLSNNNTVLLTNEIEAGVKHEYQLKITYVDSEVDQSADMNKTFSGRIDIIDRKNTIDIEGTVANYTQGDFIQTNSKKRTSNIAYDSKNKVYTYKIIGLEPDKHTISVRYKDSSEEERIRSSKDITIVKKTTESISGSTITINDSSRIAKINIDATSNNYTIEKIMPEDYNEGTLAYAIMNNDVIKKNGRRDTFTDVATTDEGMYNALDDYGTSWYFRGVQENNFVSFAGYVWRVVRINGNGSVRLILEYPLHADEVYGTQYADGSVINGSNSVKSTYNPSNKDNAYVGYMYGLPNTTTDANRCLVLENGVTVDKGATYTTKSACEAANGKWTTTAYEATHANVTNSYIKNTIDHFYVEKMINYKDYIADIVFCNDKTIAPLSIGGNSMPNSGKGYGREITYYSVGARIVYEPNTDKGTILEAKPTFKCANGADNDFSRFTVDKGATPNGSETNGDLTYPIGLLTADELVFAGFYRQKYINTEVPKKLYLINDYGTPGNYTNAPITMTPAYLNSDNITATIFSVNSAFTTFNGVSPTGKVTARPVINIKSDVLVSGGNGTSTSPYTLKLSE